MPKKKTGTVQPRQVGLGTLGFKGFTPYQSPGPPTGSYDPALDAQQRAAGRGLGDVRQDVATGNLRAGIDYGLGMEDIARDRTRGIEDYGTQTAALARSYTQLQRRQAEGARSAGVLSGGIALQAAAKRAENQGLEQKSLDTGRDRFLEDATVQEGRLGLGYQRDMFDRGQGLYRAEREGTQFGLDIGEQKSFQASQSGYVPPPPPKGQGVNAKSVPYIDRREGGFIVRYDRNGKILGKRRP